MSTITQKDLTAGEVAGSGLFDELMRTTKAHLEDSFVAGRLTEAGYATVYLGAMQSNLQAASQFVLQKEINNQQMLLLQEQVKQGEKQTAILELQRVNAVQANLDQLYNYDEMMPAQLALLQAQALQVAAQTAQATAQTTLLGTQNTNSNLESIAQLSMVGKQEDLLDEQISGEQDKQLAIPVAGLLKSQYDKAQAEINLLDQKKATETAQTTDSATGGLVLKEMSLKQAQGDSFLRDAEQKAAKFFADTYAIIFSTDQGNHAALPEYWGMSPQDSQKVMYNLKKGVDNSLPAFSELTVPPAP